MSLKPCLECGELSNATRCRDCQRARDRERGSRHERGYDNEWTKLSKAAIAAHPWCTDCGTEGDSTNPLSGDHLRWPATSIADIEVTCRRCNSARGALRHN